MIRLAIDDDRRSSSLGVLGIVVRNIRPSGLADGHERQRYDLDGQHSHRDGRRPHPDGRSSYLDGDLPLQMVTAVTPMREALLRMETAAFLTGESPIQVRKAPIRIGTVAIPGCDPPLSKCGSLIPDCDPPLRIVAFPLGIVVLPVWTGTPRAQ